MTPFALVIKPMMPPGKREGLELRVLRTAAQSNYVRFVHSLKGAEPKRWSIWVNGNWRMTLECYDGNVYVTDYEDYHW